MAEEISITFGVTATKGNLSLSIPSRTQKIDMAGTHKHATVQDIATTYEALVIPADVGTLGVAVFRNLDAANYIEVGLEVAATFYPFLKIKAGNSWPVPLGTNSLFAKANTATVKLEINALEA